MTMPPILTRQDLDADAMGVLDDLYRVLDQHWEHKYIGAAIDTPIPAWTSKVCGYLVEVRWGTFGKDSKLQAEWLQAHAPNPLTHHPFDSWEQVRDFVLHAATSMLSDPSYRLGSHFFPTTMDAWFLSCPPRKPRWSCFLRYANTPRTRRQDPVDLVALSQVPSMDAKIQMIRNAMSPEAVEAAEWAYGLSGVSIYPQTYWDRVGRLYGWYIGEAQQARVQFGVQADRQLVMRHSERWDLYIGTFTALMEAVVRWSRESDGWRGWAPHPTGLPSWDHFAEWLSGVYGLQIQLLPVNTPQTRADAERARWEKVAFDL